MATTMLVAAVISSLLRLWCQWRVHKIVKNHFRLICDSEGHLYVSGCVVSGSYEEGGRTILIKRETKAAVGIEEPNTHKLGTGSGGRARLGFERNGVRHIGSCGLALILSRSSSSNAHHQYFLVILFSLSHSHSSPLFSDMSDDGQSGGGGGGGYKLEYGPNNRAACKGTYLPSI